MTMKKRHRLLALGLCMALLAGCAPQEPSTTSDSTASSEPPTSQTSTPAETSPQLPPDTDGIIDVGVDQLPVSEETLYQQLFDKNNRIDIDIQMSEVEMLRLQMDYETMYKSPIYRMADLLITITTATDSTTYRLKEVGVRMKGNTSRTDFYTPEDGIYNAIHFKVDFQETFDDEDEYGDDAKVWDSKDERKARKNRTFATLEKLELRWNKCGDSTYLKEGYAYDVYRSEGVLAPKTNLSSLDFSGTHMGVYSVNEPVDKVFLQRNLPEEDLGGDLYKLGWTSGGADFTSTASIGIEDELAGEYYQYDLKTNKKTSEHQSLIKLITALNGGQVTKESFAELVDVDRFLSFAAVSYFMGNPDDLRNHANNCYIYFLQSSGKAIFIPYDCDRALGVTYEWDPTGNGFTEDDPFTDKTGDNNFRDDQKNPLYVYSVDAGGYYVREYAQVLERVAENDLLKPETFEELFNTAKAIYAGDATPGADLNNTHHRDMTFSLEDKSCGNLSFETYITKKMATYREYAKKVEDYTEVNVPTFTDMYIRGDFNDWSVQEGYEMTMEDGIWVYHFDKSHDFSFKLYSQVTQWWYGTMDFDENTTVDYTTEENGNIELKAGKYRVTFDPETQIVTVYAE